MGRAQEFFALIENIWQQKGWSYPVFFSSNLSSKVHFYYKHFMQWLNGNVNEQLKEDGSSPFDLKFIREWDRSMTSSQSPMLVLATPGMLHGGTSLELFKEWCGNSRNKLIVPGYCVQGTVGNLVL